MKKSAIYLLVIIGTLFFSSITHSQLLYPPDTTNQVRKMDTLCYKLKFVPLDTLIYSCNSFDSITINFGKPILKNRIEKWQVVCKSIDEKNRFLLGIKLIEYKSKEKIIKSEIKEVFDSPWLNHEVLITIDSLGDRYYHSLKDTSLHAVGPGGAFQPILFLPFLRGCKPINQTWIVNSTDTLVENAYPIPLMKQVSLFRLNPSKVISGDTCAVLEYVKSGQGVMLPSKSGIMMNLSSVINSYGELYISLSRNLPVKLNATVEQKLTILLPGEDTQPGFHYISSDYYLESYKPYVKPKNPANIIPNKSKIKKKK